MEHSPGVSCRIKWLERQVNVRIRGNYLAVAVIILVSIGTIWPVLRGISSLIPIRDNHLTSVPMFNAWTIWWNADRLGHGFSRYWDAPIFFPHGRSFALSEPQPITLIVAPVVWLTGSPVAAYNVYLLFSLCLNGIVAYVVLRRCPVSRVLATIGGVMMIWLPISMRQLEVVQLIPVWPMLWTWDAIRRHGKSLSWKTGIEASVAYSLSFYSCIHHTLFMTIALAPSAWFLVSTIRNRQFWISAVVAAMLTFVLVAVVLLPMRQALKGEHFDRSPSLVEQLSATASGLTKPPDDALFGRTSRAGVGLSPGWLKLSLALLGIVLGLLRRRKRRWVMFLALTVFITSLLALGPNLQLGTYQPWWTLADWFPGVRQVRNVFRFVYLMQMAVILLAVMALHQLEVRLVKLTGRRLVACGVVVVLGVLAIAEVPAPKMTLAGVPNLNRHLGWTNFVKSNTKDGHCIACYPFAPSTRAADFDITTRWMYYGTLHGVPMVNGYSGFFPDTYLLLRSSVTADGLTSEVLTQFRDHKVQYVVVDCHSPLSRPVSVATLPIRKVLEDPVGMIVYEIVMNDELPE